MKTCSKCGVPKDESEFYTRADLGVLMGRCKSCIAAYRETLREKDPERFKAYFKEYNGNRRVVNREKALFASKKWKKAHPERAKLSHKNTRLKSTYGITTEDVSRMLSEQGGKCGVCDCPLSQPCVDHDHKTGKLRLLLCSPCNLALGLLKDSSLIAFKAASYLQKFSS